MSAPVLPAATVEALTSAARTCGIGYHITGKHADAEAAAAAWWARKGTTAQLAAACGFEVDARAAFVRGYVESFARTVTPAPTFTLGYRFDLGPCCALHEVDVTAPDLARAIEGAARHLTARYGRGGQLVSINGADCTARRFIVASDDGGDGPRLTVATWADLVAVNEPYTVAALFDIEAGEDTVLGMCDPVLRIGDSTDTAAAFKARRFAWAAAPSLPAWGVDEMAADEWADREPGDLVAVLGLDVGGTCTTCDGLTVARLS